MVQEIAVPMVLGRMIRNEFQKNRPKV
ncbi:hypothetical protein R2601_03108 [Salipiger bermudensis HTCC2601]|uniref:Uncharacterized protein n=1 Tax=Salipiger bermudensis (strain DSM 26914 / JCM 13377 / KCTC 12554 / HTCC2601) TaxID=314265 RepID=Q0FWM4_SALBH|nr:hypothetical protein R2601_03108 [Salipiger bermudensis HTCC2601]